MSCAINTADVLAVHFLEISLQIYYEIIAGFNYLLGEQPNYRSQACSLHRV